MADCAGDQRFLNASTSELAGADSLRCRIPHVKLSCRLANHRALRHSSASPPRYVKGTVSDGGTPVGVIINFLHARPNTNDLYSAVSDPICWKRWRGLQCLPQPQSPNLPGFWARREPRSSSTFGEMR